MTDREHNEGEVPAPSIGPGPGSGRPSDIERAMSTDIPWECLVRYSRGDATDGDIGALQTWAARDDSRLALLAGARRLGELSQYRAGGQRADAAWARVRWQVARDEGSTAVLRLDPSSVSVGSPPRERAGRPWLWRRVGLATGVMAALLTITLAGVGRFHRTKAPILQEVTAPRGGRVALRLPDGTHVVLGPESRVRYAVDGGVRIRVVYLDGVALFDVAHDPAHPFVVRAAGGEAQAVGTSFGVRAFPVDSVFTVVVLEGRVALRSGESEMGSGTMLEAGQRGVLHHGLVRIESNVDVDRELGWARGQLAYDLVPLRTVVAELERWFNVEITLREPSWQHVRVTVTLPADSIDVALRRLAAVMEYEYERSGSHVYLGR